MPRLHAAAVVFCFALCGCATLQSGAAADEAAQDPFEALNRKVFDFNMVLDRDVIEPVARAYRDNVPAVVRDRIRGFFDNLAEPRIFANDILQGRGDAAGITFARFFINTTAGFAGLFDQASPAGYTRQSGDFGQTLYVWGFADGPYLVLPFFGPSSARDAVGLGVDLYSTPPAHMIGGQDANRVEAGMGVLDGIDERARNIEALDAIKQGALDLYTHFRSIWRQHRRAQLREARGEQQLPEELTDPEAAPKQ